LRRETILKIDRNVLPFRH